MKIIGFNFEKISAERKGSSDNKLEIKSNVSLREVKQEKVDVVKNQDAIRFDFDFDVNYGKEDAAILLKGFAVGLCDKNESKSILKEWKNKKIAESIQLPLLNLILTKSNLRALQLEEELGLPLHISLPRVEAKKKADYTG